VTVRVVGVVIVVVCEIGCPENVPSNFVSETLFSVTRIPLFNELLDVLEVVYKTDICCECDVIFRSVVCSVCR